MYSVLSSVETGGVLVMEYVGSACGFGSMACGEAADLPQIARNARFRNPTGFDTSTS
ncbi:hypothetical protein GCM10009550_70730 [Actinocorallia libanotica]|uniref:Uncharacterized protein n=1 Tax=Actinocorallia libanotica TaxID=46162 RepID=A0ABP4CHW5_9ACTN